MPWGRRRFLFFVALLERMLQLELLQLLQQFGRSERRQYDGRNLWSKGNLGVVLLLFTTRFSCKIDSFRFLVVSTLAFD
jgi:hypothetical protein